jgi:alpha-acetolactate decarboxylase
MSQENSFSSEEKKQMSPQVFADILRQCQATEDGEISSNNSAKSENCVCMLQTEECLKLLRHTTNKNSKPVLTKKRYECLSTNFCYAFQMENEFNMQYTRNLHLQEFNQGQIKDSYHVQPIDMVRSSEFIMGFCIQIKICILRDDFNLNDKLVLVFSS